MLYKGLGAASTYCIVALIPNNSFYYQLSKLKRLNYAIFVESSTLIWSWNIETVRQKKSGLIIIADMHKL